MKDNHLFQPDGSETIAEIERNWPGLESCGFRKQEDGRILCPDKANAETTWVYTGRINSRFCDLWHWVFFHIFHIVPSPCQACWKVVARPKNLSQLFQLASFQKQFGHPGKCGIETRDYIHALYGAYFYCDSLEEGQRIHKKVTAKIREAISPDIPVILKRGCTEFEMGNGPSNQWSISKKQIQVEQQLNEIFIRIPKDNRQSKKVLRIIHNKWVRWAYAYGDPTFRDFTEGKELYPAVITYHEGNLRNKE